MLDKARRYLAMKRPNDDEVIPTIEGLALRLKIRRETVWAWSKEEDKAEFSNIVEQIMARQGNILANKGLGGIFNPTIAKLMLSKHGYTDKIDLTSGDKPIPAPVTNILNKVYGTPTPDDDGARVA